MEELISSIMPFLQTAALGLLSILIGLGCDYIRKKTKIDITKEQEKQIWELAKRYVFHTEEKSERFKKLGHKWSSATKANETVKKFALASGLDADEAETYIDAVLAETGLAAAGKKAKEEKK